MAITFIGSASANYVAQSSFELSLPTCEENDVVIVVLASDQGSGSDVALGITSSGYNEEVNIFANATTYDNDLVVSWKRMGATPDTSVTGQSDGGGNGNVSVIAYVLRGVDRTTAMDVAVTTATSTSTSIPDCPSITPVTDGAIVVACGGAAVSDSSVTAPTGYTNQEEQNGSSGYVVTAAVCSKLWSGSGAEDPAAWTDWVSTSGRASTMATLAIRPLVASEPPTGAITATGSTPATGMAPASGSATLSTGTPSPALAVPATSGSLIATGQTPVWHDVTAFFPSTAQLQFDPQTPVFGENTLNVTLPAIIPAFTAQGMNCSLEITLPAIKFLGQMSRPAWLDVTLPAFNMEFFSGSGLTSEIPFPEILFSSVTGRTCDLDVELPDILFSSKAGSSLIAELPDIGVLFNGTAGVAGGLVVKLPPVSAEFNARVETLCHLAVNLPSIYPLFGAQQGVTSNLVVGLPAISTLLSGTSGTISDMVVSLPVLNALFNSHEDISADLVVSLPVLRMLFELSQTGRFDTETPADIESLLLKWRRPS